MSTRLASLNLQSDSACKYYGLKLASYIPSRAALNACTILLAYELGDLPFKVNAIDPGYTATDFDQHNGAGTVESAAAFIIKHTINRRQLTYGNFFLATR